jgi:MFS transporter, putative metabolite:H+ symporter
MAISSTTINVNAAARIERLPFSRWHWGIIGLAIITWLTEAIDIGLTGATIPSLKTQFGLSAEEVGLVATATTLGIVLALLAAGYLIDQYGKRNVLTFGMVLFGFATVAVAAARSISWVIVLRFAAGIGLGMVFTIPYQIVAEFLPANVRGMSIGGINAVLNLGYFANLLVASAVIPAFGWRPMYAFGGVSLVAVIFVWRFLPESPRWLEVKGHHSDADRLMTLIEARVVRSCGQPLPTVQSRLPVIESGGRVPLTEMFQGRLLWRTVWLWVVVSCLWSMFYLFSIYLPTMLKERGYALGSALLTAAFVNAAPIPTHLAGAWLLEAVGRKVTIAAYGFLALIGVTIFMFSKSHLGSLAGASLALGFMAATGSFMKLVGVEQYPTRLRGTGTTAMEAVARGIAGVIVPFFIPSILATEGVRGAGLLVLLLGIVGLALYVAFAQETRGIALEHLDPALVERDRDVGGRRTTLS